MHNKGVSSAVGKDKRRFAPKAQVKVESTAVTSGPAAESTGDSATERSNMGRRESTGRGARGGKGAKAGRGRGGRGGSGERFVMPTGQAFFTGGSTSSSVAPGPLVRGQAQAPAERSSGGVKKEKSDGFAEQDIVLPKRQAAGEDEHSSRRSAPSPDREATTDPATQWPPQNFDPLEPVELPFGPRSLTQRVQLAQQTIFADSRDSAAVEREENESVFLMQLPSSIAKGSNVPPTDGGHVPGGTEEQTLRRQMKSGKLGTIQITKSGRVYMVVDEEEQGNDSNTNDSRSKRGRRQGDGAGLDSNAPIGDEELSVMGGTPQVKRYEIHRGITPSFMQVVASVTTRAPASSGSDEHSGSSHTNSSDSGGHLHLLGAVTDKIVVTPDFDIGQRTPSVPKNVPLDCDEDGAAIMNIFEDEAAKTTAAIKSEVV